ncbi:MAG: tRNA uridine-5-carboxymethylaminomethyl(34) synthesis enzyme MnmG [Firmicutes bacterium]|nr:tRNA uridine-5-carboxymethylaminomethyl(34) synthesis enzyme MnmG [Bacillota bacterium]
MKKHFDVIVVGAGHAGVEAAHASARLGCDTLLLTMNLDSISFLACNPSIGGTAKSHIVKEVDALGGIMGIIADRSAIQVRMLNTGKGAAVHSLRAQSDKVKYHLTAKQLLEQTKNLTIYQAEVTEISPDLMVRLHTGEQISANAVVIACGVYLRSNILMGTKTFAAGPAGFARANELSSSLEKLGVTFRRFSTNTPPRVSGSTIDYTKTEIQAGDDGLTPFSNLTSKPIKNIAVCHLTFTNNETHDVIRTNMHQTPYYNGDGLLGSGPRYCPSIEDKIVRFPDRERHQLFLEPETLSSDEVYVQGLFTGMAPVVQREFIKTVPGLENAHITRDAYAIEYDCIDATNLFPSLEHKSATGIFFAGQVNGTSGYEEAAGQGLIAGVNAANSVLGRAPLVPSRTQSYIGVLIDDLVTKFTDEPYRMMTSRAEHRLHLRQDNADIRLTQIGRNIGLVCDKRWKLFQKKLRQIDTVRRQLTPKLIERVKRTEMSLPIVARELGLFDKIPMAVLEYLNIEIKYEGYLAKESARIEMVKRQESMQIPADMDYAAIAGLSSEGRTKLSSIRPQTIGQAGRISGVSPADVSILLVKLRK